MRRLRHQQQYLQTPEEQLAHAAAGGSGGAATGGASSFGSGGMVSAVGISAASISGSAHKNAGGQGLDRANLHLEMSSLANQASLHRWVSLNR